MTTVHRSVCPYDCPDACGLLVETTDDKAIKVSGDPSHPTTRGMLCPKMNHYEKTVHSPERLTQPLLRTGPKGTGQFRAITWNEAIRVIVSRWKQIIEDYGAEAILPCSYAGTMGLIQRNTGQAFFHRLGASRLDRQLCSSAKEHGWKAVMGETLAPPGEEAVKSDLLILWGQNTVATNIHFMPVVQKAKENGAKVWLIDTYENPTATICDRTVLVRPASDGALALGILHVLVRDGLTDPKFIKDHVKGFEELERDVLPDYTPAKVAQITGLTLEVVEELAQAYGRAAAPFIKLGSGLSRYGNGAMNVRLITCLPAVVGAWAKPGGGMLGNLATGSAFKLQKVTREDLQPNSTRLVSINQLGDALNDINDPPVKSLYVYHCNPAAVCPDQNRVIQGLEREDLFTVVHERFLTDTACYADVVLPATSSLEQTDIFRSDGHYGVQLSRQAIPPVGEAKSNWDTFRLLAEALGFQEDIFYRTVDELIEEQLAEPTSWLEKLDLDSLRRGEPLTLPLSEGYKLDFRTPSGKIEIVNPKEEMPVPSYFEPYGGAGEFWLMTAPSIYTLNSSFNERPDMLEKKGAPDLQMNPAGGERLGLADGQRVKAINEHGESIFFLKLTPKVPPGVAVADSVFWLRDLPGSRGVNALTSQKLTDGGRGSTFYDNKVDVIAEK